MLLLVANAQPALARTFHTVVHSASASLPPRPVSTLHVARFGGELQFHARFFSTTFPMPTPIDFRALHTLMGCAEVRSHEGRPAFPANDRLAPGKKQLAASGLFKLIRRFCSWSCAGTHAPQSTQTHTARACALPRLCLPRLPRPLPSSLPCLLLSIPPQPFGYAHPV